VTDRRILYAAAFLRALATGLVGVLIGIYLARIGLDPAATGSVVAAGLAGVALSALIVTLRGERMGRRRALVGLSLAAAAGSLAMLLMSDVVPIAAAAFLGMINGMGRDRGAAVVIDQTILPATVPDERRTSAFAWYNVAQDAGHALGGLSASIPMLLRTLFAFDETSALRLTLAGAACVPLLTALLSARLSPAVEAAVPAPARVRVSPATRSILLKIAALFAVDSLAGGFLTSALLSYFFYERFGIGEGALGLLFFAARLANAASHLGAASLARRFGLVNTMVFTHIPSSLLLAAVPFADGFPAAAALFLLREGLVEMDVPTRQSYVMAVVRPEERTVAAGATHLVRLASWAAAPAFAGLLMRGLSIGAPLFVGAGMKIVYDLLLYAAFRGHRPPEEIRRAEREEA
jgi:MFS family permease